MQNNQHQFLIAFSYPGQHRPLVQTILSLLESQIPKEQIFYDRNHEHQTLGPGGDENLKRIYHQQSLLVVPIFCQAYNQSHWCAKVEWPAIYNLWISPENKKRVLPFSLDAQTPPGFEHSQDLFKEITQNTDPNEIATLILNRLAELNSTSHPNIDISRIEKYAPPNLVGRENELSLLNDAWSQNWKLEIGNRQSPPRILTFVAQGGEGKTALINHWLNQQSAQHWPHCQAAFAWSFYSQGTQEYSNASSDLFFSTALDFFHHPDPTSLRDPHQKGVALAHLVASHRSLLILDGLEPLQHPPKPPFNGELRDPAILALLQTLAKENPGLCIVTTRQPIPDLAPYHNSTAPEISLRRLSPQAGLQLLTQVLSTSPSISSVCHCSVSSVESPPTNNPQDLKHLVEQVDGHALSLTLLGSYIKKAHNGILPHPHFISFADANSLTLQGHAFHIMDAYVKWFENADTPELRSKHPNSPTGAQSLSLLRLLGLFDRPAPIDCLQVLWSGHPIPTLTDSLTPLSEPQRNALIHDLHSAHLLIPHYANNKLLSLDAHPLLREYFAAQLQKNNPQAWKEAHNRLYTHLASTTSDQKENPTLADLQPLFQSIPHACHAGKAVEAFDKIFWNRILRGNEHYSLSKLGAFGSDLGALACFFKTPWTELLPGFPENDQAWLLGNAAIFLSALGQLTESLDPMRKGVEMVEKQEDWTNTATGFSNLSELELTIGQIFKAIQDADHSVTFADRSKDKFEQLVNRTTLADAHHQSGHPKEAQNLFEQAEQLQKVDSPHINYLYSLRGFQYCDLLLAPHERSAWQTLLQLPKIQNPDWNPHTQVLHRAEDSLKVVKNLLSIALDYLTLSRAALYKAIDRG